MGKTRQKWSNNGPKRVMSKFGCLPHLVTIGVISKRLPMLIMLTIMFRMLPIMLTSCMLIMMPMMPMLTVVPPHTDADVAGEGVVADRGDTAALLAGQGVAAPRTGGARHRITVSHSHYTTPLEHLTQHLFDAEFDPFFCWSR